MKPLIVASNMLNERDQLEEWFLFVRNIADGGILIVDAGSTDGTVEYAKQQGAEVIVDAITQREGYGPARTHLRTVAKQVFPKAHWLVYLDGDERIDAEEFHQLRYIKDYLAPEFDVVAFPRIDWKNKERTEMAKDWVSQPDYQARMTRLFSPIKYIRRLHEQVQTNKKIFARLSNPKINHFHRIAGKEKRDFVGRLCAKLHMEDTEHGHTYPKHHKEAMYREQYEKEGL